MPLLSFFAASLLVASAAAAEAGPPPDSTKPGSRLKELVNLEGVRDNQLLGYGLVVGLNGTGDKRQTVFPAQTLSNLLERMGVSVAPAALQAKNTAAVMITATLPAFAQPGTRIDVQAAAMGDATNLQGGLLLMTPLKAATGQVFAVAQGPVVTGGFVAGRGGNSQTVNHPTAGRIPQGAIVEYAPPSTFATDHLRLQLRRPDFTTASRVAAAINLQFGPASQGKLAAAGPALFARAENPSLVVVDVPPSWRARTVEFVAAIESLRVEPDRQSRIVINEKTGTITMGKDLRIAPVSILHGNLTVEIETAFDVSQPNPLAQGDTVVVPKVGVGVNAEKARNVSLKEGATIEDLVQAMLAIGSTPRDVIAILQNLKSAGALDAEIEVI
ncbi:MAG: flagellar basal body P-ring protein FlgI [Bryobacteraceae bacterium]